MTTRSFDESILYSFVRSTDPSFEHSSIPEIVSEVTCRSSKDKAVNWGARSESQQEKAMDRLGGYSLDRHMDTEDIAACLDKWLKKTECKAKRSIEMDVLRITPASLELARNTRMLNPDLPGEVLVVTPVGTYLDSPCGVVESSQLHAERGRAGSESVASKEALLTAKQTSKGFYAVVLISLGFISMFASLQLANSLS
eukprot:gene3334-13362_t